jgi:L-seryl-tRNA(Ser) seleniumtransferase
VVSLGPKQGIDLETLRDALLKTDPPLVGRVEDGHLCLDPRTLQRGEIQQVAEVLRQAVSKIAGNKSHGETP